MADSREAVLSRLGAKFSQTSLTALCRSLTMFLIRPAIGSASAKLMSGVYFCLARRLLMVTPLRLALFIDAQNAYRRARGRFFPNPQSNVDGQFDPVKLGQLIANRRGPGGVPCSLSDVRMYSGRPDPNRDQRTHAAHMKQSNRWRADGATVITQGLRYPPTWPTEPAQEKGIDVALAIDFVRLAITGAYDVGVMMSTDTDLLPALRFVYDHKPGIIHAAVAAWGIPTDSRRLRLPDANVWCHWLGQADYNAVADLSRY